MAHPLKPPAAWTHRVAGYHWQPQREGATDALVFRLHAPSKPTLFVKTQELTSLAELPDEIERLKWLAAQGIPCPRVLAHTRTAERAWLLMSAVPGRSLASAAALDCDRAVRIAADALRRLHALDIAGCPFDHRIEYRIAAARARIEAGLVDECDFDAEHRGTHPRALYEKLLAQQPTSEDLVVTHGDACLSNLIADDEGFSGFVDCGRLGIADRHQDLALLSRDLAEVFGTRSVERFFAAYGAPVDPERLAVYRLLDEFF